MTSAVDGEPWNTHAWLMLAPHAVDNRSRAVCIELGTSQPSMGQVPGRVTADKAASSGWVEVLGSCLCRRAIKPAHPSCLPPLHIAPTVVIAVKLALVCLIDVSLGVHIGEHHVVVVLDIVHGKLPKARVRLIHGASACRARRSTLYDVHAS